jgi:hypothetical protein
MVGHSYIDNVTLLASVLIVLSCQAFIFKNQNEEDITISYDKGNAQIEIGGPYVGVEMHNSSPLINRFSFYYPVANSIDLSTDYWNRDQVRTLYLGLKFGENPRSWIKPDPIEYSLTPYSVNFQKEDHEKRLTFSYEFCLNKPAMVAEFIITNTSAEAKTVEFYTHLEATLRTSIHTWKPH